MTSILNLTKTMGKVYTKLTVTNRGDQFLAKRGIVSEEQVRSITIDQVLVDTGATTLCLPAEIIEMLGLELLKKVDVATAMGLGKANIYRDATIFLHGREGTFESAIPNSERFCAISAIYRNIKNYKLLLV